MAVQPFTQIVRLMFCCVTLRSSQPGVDAGGSVCAKASRIRYTGIVRFNVSFLTGGPGLVSWAASFQSGLSSCVT